MNPPALELRDVSSGYGAARVVHNVSMQVEFGEVVVLLGKNGMGKTTLLRTVMGYNKLQSGTVSVMGHDIAKASVHERPRMGVAYAPQERALFQDLSVRDNLRLGLARDSKFATALDRVHSLFPFLAERLGQQAGTLSGGEQKMLLMARALMTDARLILIDEVTEGLQPSVVGQLAKIIRHAARSEGRAILLVEQHVGFALSVADRYIALKLGQIVGQGPAEDKNIRKTVEEYFRV